MTTFTGINRNMGCIEILPAVSDLRYPHLINRNMGCIEIRISSSDYFHSHPINRNMGCIEIVLWQDILPEM